MLDTADMYLSGVATGASLRRGSEGDTVAGVLVMAVQLSTHSLVFLSIQNKGTIYTCELISVVK